MKLMLNKVTEIILRTEQKIVVEGEPSQIVPVFATFGDLLLMTINVAPEQGFSITDIKARLKLANAIEAGKGDNVKIGEIFIDDAELPISPELNPTKKGVILGSIIGLLLAIVYIAFKQSLNEFKGLG